MLYPGASRSKHRSPVSVSPDGFRWVSVRVPGHVARRGRCRLECNFSPRERVEGDAAVAAARYSAARCRDEQPHLAAAPDLIYNPALMSDHHLGECEQNPQWRFQPSCADRAVVHPGFPSSVLVIGLSHITRTLVTPLAMKRDRSKIYCGTIGLVSDECGKDQAGI
jgi:hypothetical protein